MDTREDDNPITDRPEKTFHLWRLLGVIGIVMLVLMGVAALVNVLVLGY